MRTNHPIFLAASSIASKMLSLGMMVAMGIRSTFSIVVLTIGAHTTAFAPSSQPLSQL
jgi:hypothetical protein